MGDYISDEVEVSSTKPLVLDVVEALGKEASVGYVISDDGSVDVQINSKGAPKIRLNTSDVLRFRKTEEWHIRSIYVTTSSATSLTVRYLLKQ